MEEEIFLFSDKFRPARSVLRSPQTRTKLVPIALFRGINRPERENDRLLQSNAYVKDASNRTFPPAIFLRESAGTTLSLFGMIYWHEINKGARDMSFGRSHEKYI